MALAREWGATDIITDQGDAAIKQLQDLTDGYGADAVLECVGTKDATATAFAIAQAGPSSAASASRTTPRSTPRGLSTATSACVAAPPRLAATSRSCSRRS